MIPVRVTSCARNGYRRWRWTPALGGVYKFSESSHIQEIRRNMTELLGLKMSWLGVEDSTRCTWVVTLTQAWAPGSLALVRAVTSDKSLEAMEYREDLEYYWIDGLRSWDFLRSSCVLLQNVFHNFRNATQGLPEEKGIFNSPILRTLLKFWRTWGPIKILNTWRVTTSNENRKWRTSNIWPFASNVYFLLRNCSGAYSVCFCQWKNKSASPAVNLSAAAGRTSLHFQLRLRRVIPFTVKTHRTMNIYFRPDDRF